MIKANSQGTDNKKNLAEGAEDIDRNINDIRGALLGIADLEEGVLQHIKSHLDKMLDTIYTQVQAYQKVAAKDAMVSETPITQADEALISGLDNIADELSAKNQEILKLQRSLELLGLEATGSMQSVEMLRQQLDELNKRNRILKALHNQLARHPIMTGQVPRGITADDLKKMLVKISDQLKGFHKENMRNKLAQKAPHADLKVGDMNAPTADVTKPRGPKR